MFSQAPRPGVTGELWLLTDEGGGGQLALVHAVDGAVGAHGAARSQAVEDLARLNQRFTRQAAREFTVGLQGKKERTSHQATAHRELLS